MSPERIAEKLGVSLGYVTDRLSPSPFDDFTLDEIIEAFVIAEEKSEIERLAMVRWLSLCNTPEEAHEAHDRTISGSEAERLATVKWDELSLKEVQEAAPEEIQLAFNNARSGSEAERLAIQRLAEMPD